MKDLEFLQLKKQDFSDKIRFYFIYKNKHYFINNGHFRSGFSSKIIITKDRDKILSAFSKMGFLFDEIIRMHIVGYSKEKNNDELLYVLNLVPLNRKIRIFLDWKVFSPEFTRDMSRLFEVRNALSHAVSIDDVNYNPNKEISLSSQKGFCKFKGDFEKSWKKLLKVYEEEQKPVYSQLEMFSQRISKNNV
ncbi:MAG: hypothetical protein OEL81_03210 [Nitrosopumilus sp.]|nr:hypothetical protein [Nitrosopumilus sp.]MDH3488264.1 hypothetical protein [Nitrosopumilus sp.]